MSELTIQKAPDIALCRENYSREIIGVMHQTQFNAFVRVRRQVRHRWCQDSVTWLCDKQQCDELKQFHRNIQSNWFEINLPTWSGLKTTVVCFASALTVAPIAKSFKVNALLTVPQPDIIPDNILTERLLEMIGINNGQFVQPLNHFLNHVWPDYWN